MTATADLTTLQLMNIARDLKDLAAASVSGCVLVPTMGALHAGHMALIRKAREVVKPGKPVVVSIFVNPTQFGPSEDYSRYPRMLEKDSSAAMSAGADIIFAPEVSTVYPAGESIAVPELPALATRPRLEDEKRPTHFAGVCQVVARLFDLIRPASAIFGEKDYQQLRVIESMVDNEGRHWPGLRIIAHPTVREADGLAMSSRNAYLEPVDRDRALGLSRALKAAQDAVTKMRPPPEIERVMHETLHKHNLVVDYAFVRDAASLMPIDRMVAPARALIAARLGSVRLIDNAAIP